MMMFDQKISEDIKNLLSLNIEIEGLLRVLEAHTSEEAIALLNEKFDRYSYLMYTTLAKSQNSIANSEDPQPQTFQYEAQETLPFGPQGISEAVADKFAPTDEIPVANEDAIPNVANNALPYETSMVDDMPMQEATAFEFQTIEPPIENAPKQAVDTIDQSDMRVDQMISRNEARDLTKAFTINDKFRFNRELFDNNLAFLNSAIEQISRMSSYDEAQNFIINDLGIDPDDQTTKDFLEIIAKHFV